ncbi:MAG TPA: extracellular solute-binding protein [Candidatus Limnocylindrales bacterium]|nr:extracellular solute-binding protein [Candidatus Limnocylindrales bacterium]
MTNQSRIGIRRGSVLLASAAIVFAACSSGTPTTAPVASAPAASTAPAASPSAGGSAAASVTPSVPPASFDPSAIAAAKAYAATLGTGIGGSVSVLAVWGGSEQAQFLGMLQPFEDATGITVNYTGTRDEPAVLTAGIASGQLPDVAGLPGPAQMVQYEQAGKLQDLSKLLDVPSYTSQTPDALVKLGTTADGQLSGVFLDVSAKGQIWYDPAVTGDLSTSPPASWDALQSLITTDKAKATAPWCFSVESGAASGWPATDVLESFVLKSAGPTVYNSWWAGKTKWSDPAIKAAFQDLGTMVAGSFGGANRILTTNFANAGDPLFTTPPGCLFLHQASFITGLGAFATKTRQTDYNFFPFPALNPQYAGAVEGAGDLFGAFSNSPQTAALMKYLVSSQAQTLFVSGGEFLSANKQVTNYPNPMNQGLGSLLANATSFVFDASDQMPAPMQTEFYKELLVYIQTPAQLDAVLSDLDSVQASSYNQ